jgi:hypothetical protein
MLGFLVLALLGMLIFGVILISGELLTFGGGALLVFGPKKNNSEAESKVSEADLKKGQGCLRNLGTAAAGAGGFAMLGFGLAFVSILGFICSASVNLVIWFPTIIEFIKSLFHAG